MSVAPYDPERPADAGVPLVPLTLEGLYRAHAPLVARWAAHLGGPSVDVEDVVHEIFIIVRRRLPEFRGEAKPTTWLYRITERVVRDCRRKERFRRWIRVTRRDQVNDALVDPGRARPRTSSGASGSPGSMRSSTRCRTSIGRC